MLLEAVVELAEEASEAGDCNVSIILFTLAGCICSENLGLLDKMADMCFLFAKSAKEILEGEL